MIDELREYEFTLECWDKYWELFTGLCLPIRSNDFGILRGMWLEQTGDKVRFLHMWRYSSLEARSRLRGELLKIDAWRNEFLPEAASQIGKQFLQVLNPRLGGNDLLNSAAACFMHLYPCPAGKANAVIQQIEDGMGEADPRLLSVWATEFADPNQVVVLSSAEHAPHIAVEILAGIRTRKLRSLSVPG